MRLEFISLNEFHWLIYIERQFGLVFKVFRFEFLSVGEFESGFEFLELPIVSQWEFFRVLIVICRKTVSPISLKR